MNRWDRPQGAFRTVRDPGRIVSMVDVTLVTRDSAELSVWNRSATAGMLTVKAEDAKDIARKLVGEPHEEETNEHGFTIYACNYTDEWVRQ